MHILQIMESGKVAIAWNRKRSGIFSHAICFRCITCEFMEEVHSDEIIINPFLCYVKKLLSFS